jgi:hypothetical protein
MDASDRVILADQKRKAETKGTCWRAPAGEHLLESTCWRAPAGEHLLESTCWRVSYGRRRADREIRTRQRRPNRITDGSERVE